MACSRLQATFPYTLRLMKFPNGPMTKLSSAELAVDRLEPGIRHPCFRLCVDRRTQHVIGSLAEHTP